MVSITEGDGTVRSQGDQSRGTLGLNKSFNRGERVLVVGSPKWNDRRARIKITKSSRPPPGVQDHVDCFTGTDRLIHRSADRLPSKIS
jgi:hypothetical protein